MFDTKQIVVNEQSVTFNSVAGTLIKSHGKSRMIRFNMASPRAEEVFSTYQPHIEIRDKQVNIIVLQTMLCSDKELLVEYIKEDDLKSEQ